MVDYKIVPGWRRKFLALVGAGYSEPLAMKRAGIGNRAVVQEKRRDPDFENEIERARAKNPDSLMGKAPSVRRKSTT